ncbi:hypothetical protein ACRQ5Q_14795 [Bradyrhizobium sp. PMVTL-01]|uniref:hypothetical protein n=1 Tax=Bradyrhizobium sp. PMVTL-01 TaxID=3434999 RepID=UPI003F72267D
MPKSNCKHFPNADDHCLVCEIEDATAPADEPADAPFWTVAIYLINRSYGGPEEGGWCYASGDRVDHALDGVPTPDILSVWMKEESADQQRERLQRVLDATVNFGRRDIGSVLSTGRYQAEVYNGHPPKHFPEKQPHYE